MRATVQRLRNIQQKLWRLKAADKNLVEGEITDAALHIGNALALMEGNYFEVNGRPYSSMSLAILAACHDSVTYRNDTEVWLMTKRELIGTASHGSFTKCPQPTQPALAQ